MANDGAPKIYTRGGDGGLTSLIGGSRVSKAHLRLEAYGTVDELNCILGSLDVEIAADFAAPRSPELAQIASELKKELRTLQCHLFNLGSQLACEDEKIRAKLPGVSDEMIRHLEVQMDRFSAQLKPLKNFVLPGGARSSCQAHSARTVCRRAERICVHLHDIFQADPTAGCDVDLTLIRYLNRLSDYFFVLARYLNHLLQIEEPVWRGKSQE